MVWLIALCLVTLRSWRAVAVVPLVLTSILFQADMGILLAFMFVWNMLGALILIPVLSHLLLPTRVVRQRAAQAAAPGDAQPAQAR